GGVSGINFNLAFSGGSVATNTVIAGAGGTEITDKGPFGQGPGVGGAGGDVLGGGIASAVTGSKAPALSPSNTARTGNAATSGAGGAGGNGGAAGSADGGGVALIASAGAPATVTIASSDTTGNTLVQLGGGAGNASDGGDGGAAGGVPGSAGQPDVG